MNLLIAATLAVACQGPGRGSALTSDLDGAWLLESVCEAEVPAPEGCTAELARVLATFNVARGTAEFTGRLPSGRYRLTTERAPSGEDVAYITLAGNRAAAQLELRADTLVISWRYVDGAAYRFVRE